MKRKIYTVFISLMLIVGFTVFQAEPRAGAQGQKQTVDVPQFDVDPFWPKPLPSTFFLGEVAGVNVDSQDHVWIVSRPRTLTDRTASASFNPPTAMCCIPAPPVIELDAAGNYLQGWGGPGPGYEWPEVEHGIFVDYTGNVWIGGSGKNDHQILKFTNNGKFLLQIGHAGKSQGSNDTDNLNGPAQFLVYQKTNELFVADGYYNRRIIVFDADTGAYKRHWGAYGNKPDDSAPRNKPSDPPPRFYFEGPGPPQFDYVHGVVISNDGLLYVCDRQNDRIQEFTPDGKFVKETFIARNTLENRGTTFEMAFSPEKEQKFAYVIDGANFKVWILDRKTMQVLGSFGRGGTYAGQWHWLHNLAVDSQGNLYTGESRGNRVQKFVFKGFSRAGMQATSSLGGYHLLKKIPVPGDGSKDYLTVDEGARRLYVSHGTRVNVIDLTSEQVVGMVDNLKGVHGVAVAPDLGRGFITNGSLNTVTIFDLKTLQHLGEVEASISPDGILYDSATGRVFALNKRGDSITVFEAVDGKLVGTIDFTGDPESPVSDGKGSVWVNLEHWSALLRVDARKLTVTGRWPTAPCVNPAPMAIDRKNNRLFIGCGNELMVVADPDTGKIITTVPIGPGVDATAFDPSTGLIFTANDGSVTVIHQDSPDKYSVVENVKTSPRAVTLALDLKAHKIYLSAVEFGPAPDSTPGNPHPVAPMLPGTFSVLVLGK